MRGRRFRLRVELCAAAALIAGSSAIAPAPATAQEQPQAGEENLSLLGSYIAGRYARSQHETAAAAEFYRQALARDPESELIVENAFLMEAAEGEWSRATELARRLVVVQPANRGAHTWLAVVAFKEKKFAEADEHLRAASAGMIGELTGTLARAWVKLAQGDGAGALALLDGNKPTE